MAFSSKHLTQGEHIEHEFRTHAKKIIGPLLVILAMLVLGTLAYFYLPQDGRPWTLVAVLALCLIVLTIWGLIPIWKWRNTVFVLTNRRLITRTGIMAKSGRDIPLYRINDVQYEKGVSDRILGCGTLLISDASDQPQLRLDDIPHVESVQVKINELLFAHFGDGDERQVAGGGVPEQRGGRPHDRDYDERYDRRQDTGRYDDRYDQQYDGQPDAVRDGYAGGDTRSMPTQAPGERSTHRPYDQGGHDDSTGTTPALRPEDNPPPRY